MTPTMRDPNMSNLLAADIQAGNLPMDVFQQAAALALANKLIAFGWTKTPQVPVTNAGREVEDSRGNTWREAAMDGREGGLKYDYAAERWVPTDPPARTKTVWDDERRRTVIVAADETTETGGVQ